METHAKRRALYQRRWECIICATRMRSAIRQPRRGASDTRYAYSLENQVCRSVALYCVRRLFTRGPHCIVSVWQYEKCARCLVWSWSRYSRWKPINLAHFVGAAGANSVLFELTLVGKFQFKITLKIDFNWIIILCCLKIGRIKFK